MKKIDEVLTRGVDEVLPNKKGLADLLHKKKVKLYLGIDPTAPMLHLGHTVGLRKLQQFADLGHEAILLFGTGTVLAGDPSQRDKTRNKITVSQIEKNISTWKKQVEPIIDFEKVKIVYNGDWLLKLTLAQILEIASHISATQLIKREMFQKRIKRGDSVWTHEVLYPLLQGYDSVAMDVDLEIGGTDQVFNMLVGRELQKKMNKKEKYVLTFPMITGTDGKSMSKTGGNCIWLTDSPNDMYGKLMKLQDTQIIPYMLLASNIPNDKISRTQKGLELKNINPMDAKKMLAFSTVLQFYGRPKAKDAEKYFEDTFQKGTFPKKPKEIQIKGNAALQEVVSLASGKSISQAKRWVGQNAVKVNGKTITNPKMKIAGGEEIKFGKKGFIKVKYS